MMKLMFLTFDNWHYKNLLEINIKSNFWNCKFTANSNLNKKLENYKVRKVKIWKYLQNNYKIIIKFVDIKIEKQCLFW